MCLDFFINLEFDIGRKFDTYMSKRFLAKINSPLDTIFKGK